MTIVVGNDHCNWKVLNDDGNPSWNSPFKLENLIVVTILYLERPLEVRKVQLYLEKTIEFGKFK